MPELKADYLVIGAGAMGMAFTDVLMTESDKTVILVDRHDRPGGHWNDAYPFVRLHQPSAFYGVNSRKLGNDTIDQAGWNAGLFELASGSEVVAYFDQVMREQFLPSGRVQYFPNCDYSGDLSFTSRVSGETYTVIADKVVDATYMNVTVPSVTTPGYEIDDGVTCVPVNQLPKVANSTTGYVIVGAGKTGMDACLWLLSNNVDPSRITWVMPRDSWMLDRASIQPGLLAAAATEIFGRQMRAAADATSLEDLFDRVDEAGALLRFDPDVFPTMYRCATVTREELEQLRRIPNIVRKVRVRRITADTMHLDEGDVALNGETVFIDCSADGLERRPPVPVFAGKQLTLQAVRTCQQVFSAAFIAHVELSMDDEAAMNTVCTPVPHPDNHIDFLRTTLSNAMNGMVWSQYPELTTWLQQSRLDGFSSPDGGGASPAADPALGEMAMKAAEKLQQYIAEAEAQGL